MRNTRFGGKCTSCCLLLLLSALVRRSKTPTAHTLIHIQTHLRPPVVETRVTCPHRHTRGGYPIFSHPPKKSHMNGTRMNFRSKIKPKKPCRKPSVSSSQYAVVDRQAAVRDRPLCTTTTCRVPPSINLQRSTAPARSQVAGPVCTPPSTCFTSVYRSMGGKRGAH